MDVSIGTAHVERWERPDAPLGTLVYRAGLVSKDKLEHALEEGRLTGRRLGQILLQKGWIDEKDLARLLAGQKGLAFVSLRGRGYDRETARLLPEQLCRFYCALAVEIADGAVVVAIADPSDESALTEIRDTLGRPLTLAVATASEIRDALDDIFGNGRTAGTGTAVPPVAPLSLVPDGERHRRGAGASLRAAPPADERPAGERNGDARLTAVDGTAALALAPSHEPRYRVMLNLEGGEDVEVRAFLTEQEAEAAAVDLAARIRGGEWPRVGRRFIRPERIVALEVLERRDVRA